MHSLALNDALAGSAAPRGSAEPDAPADAAGAGELVRVHGPGLLRLARGLVGDRDQAEDLVQEAFCRAARAMRAGALERPAGWLRQVLTRLAADGYRRRAVRERVADGEGEGALEAVVDRDQAEPPRRLQTAELKRDLARAILGLPDNLRASFVARVVEGRDYEEAAATLGLEPATVRTHVMRARKLLAERLAGHLGEER